MAHLAHHVADVSAAAAGTGGRLFFAGRQPHARLVAICASACRAGRVALVLSWQCNRSRDLSVGGRGDRSYPAGRDGVVDAFRATWAGADLGESPANTAARA